MKKKIFSVESLKLIQVKQRKDEYMVQLSASQITTGKDNPGTEPIRIHSCCHFTPGRTFRSPDPERQLQLQQAPQQLVRQLLQQPARPVQQQQQRRRLRRRQQQQVPPQRRQQQRLRQQRQRPRQPPQQQQLR
ncbi:unnamed protein product [Rotaria magnacalcarata]